jgi:HD-like signal output (HDOD) protein
VHHAQVGEWLAERWHFPTDLLESIAYHHTPHHPGIVRPKVVATVYLANWIASQIALTKAKVAPVVPLSPEVLDLLQVENGEKGQLCQEVEREEAKIREMLSLIS